MPGQLKCNSCGGIYPDTTTPGHVAYFHVCPSKIVKTPEITDAGHNITTPCVFQDTPNPRNENTLPNPVAGQPPVMIALGGGVTVV